MRRRHLGWAVLLVGGSLSACGSTEDAKGPFSAQGYQDGCRTAEARQASFSTRVHRDEALFEEQASYRAGWRQGYAQCGQRSGAGSRPGDLGERNPR